MPTAAVLLYAASSAVRSIPRKSMASSLVPLHRSALSLPRFVFGKGLLVGRIRSRKPCPAADLLEDERLELLLLQPLLGDLVGHHARDAHDALAVTDHDVAGHHEHLRAADGHVLVHRHVAHDVRWRRRAEGIHGEAEGLHRWIVADAAVEHEAGCAAHLEARDQNVARVRRAGHSATIHHQHLPRLDVLDGVTLWIARIAQDLVAGAILAGWREAHGHRFARHALVGTERSHAGEEGVPEAELEELRGQRGSGDAAQPVERVGSERGSRSHGASSWTAGGDAPAMAICGEILLDVWWGGSRRFELTRNPT